MGTGRQGFALPFSHNHRETGQDGKASWRSAKLRQSGDSAEDSGPFKPPRQCGAGQAAERERCGGFEHRSARGSEGRWAPGQAPGEGLCSDQLPSAQPRRPVSQGNQRDVRFGSRVHTANLRMLFILSFLSCPAFSSFFFPSDLHLLFDLPWRSLSDHKLASFGKAAADKSSATFPRPVAPS